MERSSKLLNLSFFLALGIVFVHSRMPISPDFVPESITAIRSVHYYQDIPLSTFFFFTGYLFFRNFSLDDYARKMKARFHSLAVPYLVWNTLSALVWFAVINLGGALYVTDNRPFEDISHVILNIIGCQYTLLWYVWVIIVFAICSPLIYYMIRERKRFWCFFALFTVVSIVFKHTYCSPLAALPIYMLGSWVGMHHRDFMFKEQPRWITALTVPLLVCFVVVKELLDSRQVMAMLKLVAPFAVIGVYDIADRFVHFKSYSFYSYSFFLYAAHYIPIHVLQRYFLFNYGIGCAWYVYVLVPVFVTIAVLFVAHFIRLHFHTLHGLLTGNR